MTRGEAKAALRAFGYETDADTPQNEALAGAIRDFSSSRQWPWLMTSYTESLAEGDNSIANLHATEARTITALELVADDDDVRVNLEPITIDRLRELRDEDDEVQSEPLYWSHDTAIYVWPRANVAYTATLYAVKDVEGSSLLPDDDNDELPGPPEVHDAYVWGALLRFAYRERDPALAGMAKQEYRERMLQAIQQYGLKSRQATRVRRSNFWSSINNG